MSDLDLVGDWARLEGALQRFAAYVQAATGPPDTVSDTYARLGLAVHAKTLFKEGFRLAKGSGVLDQYLRLFTTENEDKDAMEAVTEIEHSLAGVVLLAGFVEGHVKAVTLEVRIREEAEAYARERVKSERIGFKPTPNGDTG